MKSSSWIDRHWAAVGEVFPGFTMDWLYEEHGAERLKHHRWMLTRPSFQTVTRELHSMFTTDGETLVRCVAQNREFTFPTGMQRQLALRFLRRMQRPDGADIVAFLAATACEMIGTAPFCAYQEPELKQWVMAAGDEKVDYYGTVLNLLINVVAQTMLWILGCFPYTALNQHLMPVAANHFMFWTDLDAAGYEHRQLLRRYCWRLYEKLTRIGRSVPRTYRESESL